MKASCGDIVNLRVGEQICNPKDGDILFDILTDEMHVVRVNGEEVSCECGLLINKDEWWKMLRLTYQ